MSAAEIIEGLLRPDLRGASPYGAPQLDVPVALNTNENAFPVPAEVAAAIADAVARVAPTLNRYPDREFTALREALAGYLSRSGTLIGPDQIWAANGSNEVLAHLLQAFGGPGRRALGFTPSYSMHPIIAGVTATQWIDGVRGEGADGEFDVTAESARAQVRAVDPDIVFLTSPNNPTGTSMDLAVIEAVHDASPRALVIVDEAYHEFARPGTPSALTLLADRPRLVVSRTMSKAFALAGARLGYLAADPALTQALRLVRLPYHLSSQTQAVALAALAHTDTMLGTVNELIGQRDRIVAGTSDLGLTPVPSDANFVLVGGFADAAAAWRALVERGVLVRDVGIEHYLRISAGTAEETSRVLTALSEIIDEVREGAT